MDRGVRGFVFEILSRNISMLRLAERAQGTLTVSRDDDVVHVTVLFADSASTSAVRQPDSLRLVTPASK
jgi:hypothetical protein